MASFTKEDLVKEAFSVNLVYRLLKNKRIELTGRLQEFFYLFQVPEVRQSIFAKIIELKFIFKDEIAKYFKEAEDPCKKIVVILKERRGQKFVTREQDGHSFHIELFPNNVDGGYAWNINNSGDKEKWGEERDFYVARSLDKRYNFREECLPDIAQKVLEIYGEDVQFTLEMSPELKQDL